MAIAEPKIPKWEKASGTLKRDEKIVRQLRLDFNFPFGQHRGQQGTETAEVEEVNVKTFFKTVSLNASPLLAGDSNRPKTVF